MTDLAADRATYRSVLGHPEFRAVFLSDVVSLVGDQIARIAVAILVLDRTGSALAASATYAASYLAWLVGGPVLSTVADLLPRRRTMVAADLVRAGLVAVLLLPGLPVPVVFALLVAIALLSPPFEAARSALLADVLEGDRYVAGNGLINTAGQLAQVAGFVVGGALVALVGIHGALVIDAISFALSALLLVTAVQERPLTGTDGPREPFLAALAGGIRLVASDRRLAALLGWAALVSAVTIAPEGLAVVVARDRGGGSLAVGILTAAVPAGFVLGSWLVLRLTPARRRALFPWLAVLSSVPLILTPIAGGVVAVAALWFLAGIGTAVNTVANPLFIQAVPARLRGRAFGVAASVIMAVQGIVLLMSGAIAERLTPSAAVSLVAATGLAVIGVTVALSAVTRLDDGVRPLSRRSPRG